MQRKRSWPYCCWVWFAVWASQGFVLVGRLGGGVCLPEVTVLPSGDSSVPTELFQGLSPDQLQRAQLLIHADTLYREGIGPG
jgi:hypothetical protein